MRSAAHPGAPAGASSDHAAASPKELVAAARRLRDDVATVLSAPDEARSTARSQHDAGRDVGAPHRVVVDTAGHELLGGWLRLGERSTQQARALFDLTDPGWAQENSAFRQIFSALFVPDARARGEAVRVLDLLDSTERPPDVDFHAGDIRDAAARRRRPRARRRAQPSPCSGSSGASPRG